MNPEKLELLVTRQMPFGKYKGQLLIDLPEPYLVWFERHGFPKGKLGERLATVASIKSANPAANAISTLTDG